EPDPVTVVRASGIKGQLRFWWRAIRGWKAHGDLLKLRDLDEKYFGSVGDEGRQGPSPVVLRVISVSNSLPTPAWKTKTKAEDVAPGYLSFPLQPDTSGSPSGKLIEKVKFQLEIELRPPKGMSLNELGQEVEAALWAWETFGGVGARTRRGFGAVRRTDASSAQRTAEQVQEQIKDRLRQYIEDTHWPAGVPHLTPESPVAVVQKPWKTVAEQYQRFRQSRGSDGRGKSLWPEPETIRKLRKKPTESGKFPRGQLGLPIIFHFKDEEDEAYNSTLKPKSKEFDRLASPLIFRPIAENMTVVVVLQGSREVPGGVQLEFNKDKTSVDVEVQLDKGEAAKIRVLNGQTDVVQAAFDHLTRRHQGGKGGYRR
ncbi:MAG: type III-B CRISPR module RAMP protein Cmr1, partial [Clostridiales bacterium]|nr:type III-B CRISPR module RAMP protein Cmr1 [Clostridiales bacterium]